MDPSTEATGPRPPPIPSPSRSPRPLTEFILFPKLIIELRLKIWALCYTLQEPRLVEVRTQPHACGDHQHKGGWCPRFSAGGRRSIPTLVQVSGEARMVAREQARRAGHLCFGGTPGEGGALPDVIFNPEVDRLYLPVEKRESWSREADGEERRWRGRADRGMDRLYASPGPPGGVDDGPAPVVVSSTTLFQFKKCHRPAAVRFLVSDLDIRLGSIPHNPVWTVMQEFPKLQEIVFVAPEHCFAYADLIAELARAARVVEGERARWENASREGVVSWKWPVVRLALRCKMGLKFVELEGQID